MVFLGGALSNESSDKRRAQHDDQALNIFLRCTEIVAATDDGQQKEKKAIFV